MRIVGRITDWNDERGFGFVVPKGGGDRAFVHVSAFNRGLRRPVAGDLIAYVPGKDKRGRFQALEITYVGVKAKSQRRPFRLPRARIGLGALGVIVVMAAAGAVPFQLSLLYLVLSGLSFLLYLFDKMAAGRGGQRTPESSLHLLDLLGGWPGALVAQQRFRHKTIKQPFQAMFWITVVINVTGAVWLVWSGKASDLVQMLGG